jgi:hypothetical protein
MLASLAAQTTGFVIEGGHASPEGLQRVLREASRYYLLTLAPVDDAVDGRFRGVTVAIRRAGVTARARSGYENPRPDRSRLSATRSRPDGLKVPRRTSALIRTWFGQARAADGRTRIEFVWEPAPRVPGVRNPPAVPSRVSVAVTTMDGAPVYSGVVNPAGHEAIVASTDRPELTFEAVPGTLLVQMEVLDSAGRVLDRDVRDLVVAGFTQPLGFGTAAVYRARTLRDIRAIAAQGGDVSPVASRQFSRAEYLVIRVPLIGRDAQPLVTARLQSQFGTTLRELPVSAVAGAPDVAQVDLSLAPLASGGYVVEFRADSGGRPSASRVEFIVTP